MKIRSCVAALLAALFVSAALAATPAQVLAAPKEAPCAVCVVKEGSGPEPVRATATHEDKEYFFCREECKQEFLKNPQAFLKPNTPRPAPAFTLKDLAGNSVSLSDYRGKVVQPAPPPGGREGVTRPKAEPEHGQEAPRPGSSAPS